MRPTLVVIRHLEIEGRAFAHGSELPPDLITQEEANELLDAGSLCEYRERRSLYRLFHLFSGSKEQEQLTKEELSAHALTLSNPSQHL
jgi:hypothetical protein